MVSVQTQYRLLVWMPLGMLLLVAGLVHGIGLRPTNDLARTGVQVSLLALLYGGVPYAAIAAWATWWIGGRSERDIQRMMLVSPLLFAGFFTAVSMLVGLAVGEPRMFLSVALLGAALGVMLGYLFVLVAWVVRRALRGNVIAPPS